ncbi:polyunsaturated fatty acid lipoxygenase ALOX12-like [Clarias gariepinus]|uniref:polyunsaturated fatty acid lipoxygenase ALOX12-like n=1 Tax=Clarias gariepinus TaxID=13013 RepID=UPI00234DA2C4|nr:polyunsaturated fatty acid lipoxygenase ALOX12-like [Clarias gariepinus]
MEYNVTVNTGKYSGTNNYVYITLVGEKGESDKTLLKKHYASLKTGQSGEYKVYSGIPLGRVYLVRLETVKWKVPHLYNKWFCSYVQVTPPGRETIQTFPCYHWLVGDDKVEICDGTAKRLCDTILRQEQDHRKAQLEERQKTFRWQAWAQGIPKCIDAEHELPLDVCFDGQKEFDFDESLLSASVKLGLEEVIMCPESWEDLKSFERIFSALPESPNAVYTKKHWQEDWFFGYQFLNGVNPRMIQNCSKLPSNFAVQGNMMKDSLPPKTTLDKELKAGNIYLVDYAILDGIPPNVIEGMQQYIAAPLCLLYEHPDNGLIPIAIQLGQKPTKDTPIFLPNDPPMAWLLAKIWVRHAEFQIFEVLSHLLRTHLTAEVFCVATLRQLPAVHPIYKLLIPHMKYTLDINCRARTHLISSDGIFKKVVSTGGEGLLMLVQGEYKVLTYRSLQPLCDFKDRGVSKLNKYFYRDHSLKLWSAIENYVSRIVSLYYRCDSEVEEDAELQAWIKDVVEEGFANASNFGLPNKLQNKQELITLLSVIIFTSSAQHAAINNGQFDFCAWVPNTPCTMRQPPPTDKDSVTMEFIMSTLPNISQSCLEIAITYVLGRFPPHTMPLGQYMEQYFTEPSAKKEIDRFCDDLQDIEAEIIKQKEYLYLCPSRIENSIAI